MNTLLVIPCFNEVSRLKIDDFQIFLKSGNYLCFADDGSTDGTTDFLKSKLQMNKNVHFYRSEVNIGKANVIQSAITNMFEKSMPNEIEWIGFWDADLATPLSELNLFLTYQKNIYPNAKAVFGSRVLRLGAVIIRSPMRHYLGRIFATVAYLLLGVKSYDSQCGAKIFKRDLASYIFKEKFLSRWIFDLEILMRLDQFGVSEQVIEFPVNNWMDVPGSKLKVFKEIFRVLIDMFKIRKKYIK